MALIHVRDVLRAFTGLLAAPAAGLSRPMGEGFGSHDTGIPPDMKDHRPTGANLQGDGGHGECLWSGYRSSGCSSAEPDSLSPDKPT